MSRWLILLATVLFGIVPATFALLANALYYLRGVNDIPADSVVAVAWGQIAVVGLIACAGVVGYIALFLAARRRVTGRVAIALLIGIAAMASAIWLGLSPYWLGSPVLVGFAHAAHYHLMRGIV